MRIVLIFSTKKRLMLSNSGCNSCSIVRGGEREQSKWWSTLELVVVTGRGGVMYGRYGLDDASLRVPTKHEPYE